MTREFVDTELREVIRFLAEAMGRNVYMGPGVEGRLTVSLRSVAPVAALHEVLRCFSPNLAYKQIGNRTLVVAEPEVCEPPLALCSRPRPPKGSVRQEILLERAPAAKVITTLQEDFPEVDFIPHPLLNGFYVVGRPSDLMIIKKRVPVLDIAPEPLETSMREFVLIKFGDIVEIRNLLETLVPDVRFKVDAPQSTLMLVGSLASIEQAKELIDQLDQPLDQVILECKLVPVTEAARRNFPVDWTNEEVRTTPGGLGLQLGRFRPVEHLTLVPYQPSSASPSLATSRIGVRDDQSGGFSTGDKIPGSDLPAVALEMTSTATILDGGAKVRCKFQGRFSNITAIVRNGQPETRIVTFEGEVELKDGETAVLNGLLPTPVAVDAVTTLPWLADLPVMGHFFRDLDSERSVYLTITPNVMY